MNESSHMAPPFSKAMVVRPQPNPTYPKKMRKDNLANIERDKNDLFDNLSLTSSIGIRLPSLSMLP